MSLSPHRPTDDDDGDGNCTQFQFTLLGEMTRLFALSTTHSADRLTFNIEWQSQGKCRELCRVCPSRNWTALVTLFVNRVDSFCVNGRTMSLMSGWVCSVDNDVHSLHLSHIRLGSRGDVPARSIHPRATIEPSWCPSTLTWNSTALSDGTLFDAQPSPIRFASPLTLLVVPGCVGDEFALSKMNFRMEPLRLDM